MNKKLNYYIGIASEYIAALYLKCKLYKILSIRYRCPFGEIDIIAKKGTCIIFIEVKKRQSHLTESISAKAAQRIYNSSSYYIARNPKTQNLNARIDLIQLNKFFIPKHMQNYINW
jgi:putative endonuclease